MDSDGFVIDLLRHGQPEGGSRIRGRLDDPLSEQGWHQMWQSLGSGRPWQRILTSPLSRCQRFAEVLGATSGLQVLPESRFQELGYGAWEGKTAAEIAAQAGEGLREFWQHPRTCPPPGGEPFDAFAERVNAAYTEHCESTPSSTLIVTHAGVIRIILIRALGMPLDNAFRLRIPLAGIARLHFGDGPLRLTHFAACPPPGS